jgi:hypothetical protein
MAAGVRWRMKTPIEEKAPELQRARVEELAAMLVGIPWILGGGLAIPLTRGEFHRDHTDIDLLFDDAEFPRIEQRFADYGFSLWQHYSMSFFGHFAGAWHLRVRSDGFLARIRRRKLKFRTPDPRPDSVRLQTVDALPFRIHDGRIITCDGRHSYPLTRPLVGHVAHSAAGHPIPCLSFEYVALLKGPRREQKDLEDFAIIRDFGRLPAGDWGV